MLLRPQKADTAMYILQINRVVEFRILVLLKRARDTMYLPNFKNETRRKLWVEAISHIENSRNSMGTSRSVSKSQQTFFEMKKSIVSEPNNGRIW